jgi:hypothetical protein
MRVTAETFQSEMAAALKAYELYVVALGKSPEDFEVSLVSLVTKAIRAFESRGPQLRHGIALDKHLTVILSQNDDARPLCGIYFNLHSPYHGQVAPRAVAPLPAAIEESRGSTEN